MISQLSNRKLTPSSDKIQVYALISMVFISCLFLFFSLNLTSLKDPLVEDSFITFRTVENLLNGNGLVFNKFERVETLSNISWAMWLVFLTKLGAPILFSSAVSGVAFSLLTIWSIWLFSAQHLRRRGYVQFIAVLLLATNTGVAIHCKNGLETSLYMFLITMGTLRAVVENKNKDLFPFSAIIFSLASITRPEAPLLFAAIVMMKIFSDVQDRKISKSLIYTLFVFFIIYGAIFISRIFYYHDICPNTVYARTSSLSNFNHVCSLIIYYIKDTKFYIIFLPVIALLFRKEALKKISPVPLIVAVFMLLLLFSANRHHFNRYMLPVLPLVFLLVQEGFYTISGFNFIKKINQPFKRFSLVALLTVIIVTNLFAHKVRFRGIYTENSMIQSLQTFAENPSNILKQFLTLYNLDNNLPDNMHALFGDWIKRNLPANTVIVYDQMGQTPYYAGLNYIFIDSFGLTDRTITQIRNKGRKVLLNKTRDLIVNGIFNLKIAAVQKKLTFTEYIFLRNPDYIFILAHTKETKELLASKVFQQQYLEFIPPDFCPELMITYRRKKAPQQPRP